MRRLPVIVSMGGISPAGRSVNYDALRLIAFDEMSGQDEIVKNFSILMGIERDIDAIRQNTLIRTIPKSLFDVDAVACLIKENGTIRESTYKLGVSVGGALPTGFSIDDMYKSVKHPRSVKMGVFATNEAIAGLGVDYDDLASGIDSDKMLVVASSSLGQIDEMGLASVLNAKKIGIRTTAKKLPFSYPQTIADFISGYVIGNVGTSLGCVGACATFAYNLSVAVDAIKAGKSDFAFVGCADSQLTPDIIEAFDCMDALANDKKAEKYFSNLSESVDLTKVSRPFGKDNFGFVMGESAQVFAVCPLELAIARGLDILAAVPEVFNNADGFKKSITAPGAGNYISFAKATRSLEGFLGEHLAESFVMAHGTSTPQNRITESKIINDTARAFGIREWATTGIKSYIGHSQATAAADQLAFALMSDELSLVPGMAYVREIADDVSHSHLDILLKHKKAKHLGAIINSKGFGGNNSSFPIIFGEVVDRVIGSVFTNSEITSYHKKLEKTKQDKASYISCSNAGEYQIRYFDDRLVDDSEVEVSREKIKIASVEVNL